MRPIKYLLVALGCAAIFPVPAVYAENVEFITLNDSTTYVRVNDPDTTALTLDIKIDYTLPASGIKTADLLKMADMLMNITGVNFDSEGYPAPSPMTQYDGGEWMPATTSNSAKVQKLIDSTPEDEILFRIWSESPAIQPVYNDDELLSMLASNYVYTGGAHGMYQDFVVNYSVKEGRFVYLKDIFPGLDTPKGKRYYEEKLSPLLTAKARKLLTSDGECYLQADKVMPSPNFAFTKDGIVMRYQPYEIAPWAAGVVEVPLTWSEINSAVASMPR